MKQKKIKQVFSTSEAVAKIFAQQCQQYGCVKYVPRNGGPRSESMYFLGNNLYSYGPHYLLARILPDINGVPVAVVNFTKWSRSTDRHTSEVYRSLRTNGYLVLTVEEVATNIMRENASDIDVINAALATFKRETEKMRDNLAAYQVKPVDKWYIRQLHKKIKTHNAQAIALGLGYDFQVTLDRSALARALLLSRLESKAKKDHARRVQLRLECFSGYPFSDYSQFQKDHKRTA